MALKRQLQRVNRRKPSPSKASRLAAAAAADDDNDIIELDSDESSGTTDVDPASKPHLRQLLEVKNACVFKQVYMNQTSLLNLKTLFVFQKAN